MENPSPLALLSRSARSALSLSLQLSRGVRTVSFAPRGWIAWTASVALSACLAAVSTAQQPPSYDSIGARACGISAEDGTLRAIGPRYGAELGPDRIVYTPALGRSAARTESWSATPLSIARERGPAFELGAALPRVVGVHAELGYGATVKALYEARADGLEQSFWIESCPRGEGDLVVRQRIATNWPLASVDARTGIEWSEPDLGGVRVGGVTAIDSSGASIAGALAFADGVLEYRVPSAFVDRAQFPLLVDPLIGTLFFLGGDAGDSLFDIQPSAAFDPSTGVGLVAWIRVLSASNASVIAQRITTAGALIGGPFQVSGSVFVQIDVRPVVANCNAVDRFVVAHQRDYTSPPFSTTDAIELRTVSTNTALPLSTPALLAGALDNFALPALASQHKLSQAWLPFVYSQRGVMFGTQLSARIVQVSSGGAMTFGSDVAVHIHDPAVETVESLALSPHGGSPDQYLLAFTLESQSNGDRDIKARVFDANLAVLTPAHTIAGSASLDERDPVVAGNGDEFVVAWEQSAPSASDSGIYARRMTYNGASLVIEPTRTVADTGSAERNPALGYSGESYVVAWELPLQSSTDDLRIAALNKWTLEACGAVQSISSASHDLRRPLIASRYSVAGPVSDVALVTFEGAATSGGATDIYGQLVETENGSETQLGGGCGLFSGVARAGCSVSSTSTLPLSLRGAIANAPAFLFLSLNPLGYSEGGCTLYADPFGGFLVAAGNTNTLGEKDYSVPLNPDPALVGLEYHLQWGTYLGALGAFKIGGTVTGLNLSTAVRATFQ
jgi:hypothetical protein